MVNLNLLVKLLQSKEDDIKSYETEKLRTILGVFRYYIRILERELNSRESEAPF